MRVLLVASLAITFVATTNPAMTAERACRPSLSNFYHCPDSKGASTQPSTSTQPTTSSSSRTCHPSASNFWTCPGNKAPKPTTSARACRPSLSNGYSCPGGSSVSTRANQAPPKQQEGTTAATERGCRPSLSNGYKCPGEPSPRATTTDSAQYSTEWQARSHCPSDTVVWANTRSNIYHFRGTSNYGNTVAGAYMCEQDSLREGMRAAKNETHPQ
jgi:hypothetical protein